MTILDTAVGIIEQSTEYATTILDEANSMVDQAQTFAQGWVNLAVHELDWEGTGELDETELLKGEPDKFKEKYKEPSDKDVEVPEMGEVFVPEMPDFPASPPAFDSSKLFKAVLPTWDVPDLSEDAPTFDELENPDAPTVTLPDDPESATDRLEVPTIVVPTFDKSVSGTIPTPEDGSERFIEEYADRYPVMVDAARAYVEAWMNQYSPGYAAALEQLEAKIAEGMPGGKALPDSFEDALYERARARLLAERDDMQRVVTEDAASRGFVLPPGAMTAGLLRVQEQAAKNMAIEASNTHVERARMEIQHVQFVMQLSASLRQAFLQGALSYMANVSQINGQAIEYARLVAQWAAELFNQRLSAFQAEVQLYQTEAEVYKVRLESAFAELRVFEAEVAAEKLLVEVDQAQIALYNAKVNAQRQKIDLYIAELQGISEIVKQRQLELQVYEAQVRGYIARVEGKTAEYGAYEASLRGDAARVQVYSEQVRAFAAEVDAVTAQVNAGRIQSEATIAYNKNLIDVFDANIRKYEADLRGETTRITSEMEIQKTALQQYLGTLEGRLKIVSTQYEHDRLALQAAIANMEGRIRTSIAQGDLFQKTIDATARTALAGADVLRGIGGAAVSANNTLVNLVTEE